jgi:hypothetical protein
MSPGPLVAADESFDHPVADDPSWTEKVCAMAAARDGSLQAAFGMGVYANRGVRDAYAGVSRGKEQWTVRSSTSADRAGPITYEVLEPLKVVRFALAENDVVPISFEWTFRGALPAVREEPSQFEKNLTRPSTACATNSSTRCRRAITRGASATSDRSPIAQM